MEIPVNTLFSVEIWDLPFHSSDDQIIGVHGIAMLTAAKTARKELAVSVVFH
jgi:hypothetical protein